MGILRTDRVSGLGGANAIKGSVFFGNGDNNEPSSSGASGNDFLRTEHSSNFTFGTGDLTMEGWFFIETIADNWQTLIADSIYYAQGGFTLYINNSQLIMYDGQGSGIVNGGTLTAAKWSHIAYSRESNSHKLFIDGELVATASSSYEFTGTDIIIGANKVGQSNNADTGGYPFRGFASNVRIIKGRALYTATFTPPKGELEVTSDTVLLSCQSPGNVLQEATGVILTTSTYNNSSGAKASHFTPNSPVGFSTTSDVGTQFGSTFDGVTTFDSQAYMVPPGGNTRERNRGRGLIIANYIATASSNYNTSEFITIQSMGNSQDFGDTSAAVRGHATLASSTRAVSASGYVAPANVNTIEFFTIATQSNSTDFGDMNGGNGSYTPISNETRGIFAGGYAYPALFNNIDFITIATTGNSQDFAGLTTLRADGNRSAVNSPTRGLIAGGYISPTGTNNIEFVTIASTGNSQDFGDLTAGRGNFTGLCSSTRGVFAGGTNPSNNIIDFVTIASQGTNASDFGDMFVNQAGACASTSNNTRGVIVGGDLQPSNAFTNTMQHITIATTGDSLDFGDMLTVGAYRNMTSDSHGGLS